MTIKNLQGVHSYGALAPLFSVTPAALKAQLYSAKGYSSFNIPKKSGGFRLIHAPTKIRKQLQRALLPVLNEAYKAPSFVHGFVDKRSVRSNAQPHVQARTVVNVDLADFFQSISFKRIRGVFLAPPFRFDWTISNILAQICCYGGALPAGGVTSPTLSNMICARMDKKLVRLSRRLGGEYSRYADDLTFSFRRPLAQLSSIVAVDASGNYLPGAALLEIFNAEGFSLNPVKFRVATGAARKLVTGVVVNHRTNVPRKWLRALESKIYAITRFGVGAIAAQEFPDVAPESARYRLLRQLHGRISYLRMIRGAGDWVASDLAYRFNKAHGENQLRVPCTELISNPQRVPRGVWVLGCSASTMHFFDPQNQGTAFVTSSGLLVTAAHVLLLDSGDVAGYIYIINERAKKLRRCELLAIDVEADVAILKASEHNLEVERSRFSLGNDPQSQDSVVAVGYSDYGSGDTATMLQASVQKVFKFNSIKKAQVGAFISGGMSGGPVVDSACRVRGLVHKGVSSAAGVSEIICVEAIIRVAVSNSLSL
ncbi:reverse transcriptase domain-containing protein [Xanthomonas hortorum pv. vitians]|uniref:RNA-directed DNA polymerase n=1 Tax=Xanthomonas hortorum pv. vitians TaxID=83224 RepID=A0AAW8ZSG0_9XANT|nr:reverse transcriptase domain-containing protein [Xanthomonas hortorum]MCC8495152.1 trypsin-like peptidase domain-containing protein [Xanthomonas hortorum pv. gardneri]MCE4283218.1 trypsin-like peptidase domain-containing protein [Xanthomonas hortorum pv. vitians]MCE4287475.1 trypsin-like peptidase domain-containing protein [Xanthomonas hortorum pv. vitians]MCE4291917.1 trypsin-like peptidase domain-containing protein [Xanthomonas hortorum pv. vitians]MCE4296222.1 trypsin-like peptidase doma